MKPSLVQMVRVPINGRNELMTHADAESLYIQLATLMTAEAVDSRTIKAVVCVEFGVTLEQMNSDTRREEICMARQVAMMIHRKLTGMSLCKIGELFPRKGHPRDHGTVLHACRAVEARMVCDDDFKAKIKSILSKLTKAKP